MRTIALLISSVAFFAIADIAVSGVDRSSGDPWSDYLVWAISVGLAAWGIVLWFKRSPKPKWLVVVGSIVAVSAVVISDLAVGVLISCSRGVCL